MATSIQFLYHYRLDGVDYLPGQVASVSDLDAIRLVNAYKAVYTSGPPTPVGNADPFPQYATDQDLADLQAIVDGLASNSGAVASVDGRIGFVDLSDLYDPLGAAAAASMRENHTGFQTAATISDFTEAVQDAVAAFLGVSGTGITRVYDDENDTLTLTVTGGGSSDPEAIRDAIGVAMQGVGLITVTVDDTGDTITVTTTATQNSTDAQLRDRTTHTGEQPISTITDLQATLDLLAGRITMVNGDTGPEINLGLGSMFDVWLDAPLLDDDGNIVDPGPEDGDYIGFDATAGVWRNMLIDGSKHSHDGVYAPLDYKPKWMLEGVVLEPGETAPDELPLGAVIIDKGKPSALVFQIVNTVGTTGSGTVTLPGPTTATIHDVTLTGDPTLDFPTPTPGATIVVLLRQDATGSRTVTWDANVDFGTDGTPTLTTTGQGKDLFVFVCIGGTTWLCQEHKTFGGTAQPGPTPTVRGTWSANSGAANNLSTVSSTLPPGIVAGDVGYMLVSATGQTETLTAPAGWEVLDGPVQMATSLRAWLLRRVMDGSESGAAITSGTLSATQRPAMTGIVLAGATTSGEVRVNLVDSTVDPVLDVSAITPLIGNSLLVHLTALRTVPSTTAQAITPAAGWTEQVEHSENRLDGTNVSIGGYIETKPLTGQANSEQSATTAAYTLNASEIGFVVAVPPPVS